MQSPETAPRLSQEIRASHFFALGFGTIIGVGWVIVLGEWLTQAGPLGAILAFAAGGAVMMLVGLCYAEVSTLLPVSGGEVAYAYEIYGPKACFAAGWSLTLVYVAFTTFEAVSLGWVLGTLLPGSEGPTLYTLWGAPVRLGSLLLGLGGMGLLTYLSYRGTKEAASFQSALTWALIASSAVFIGAGLLRGEMVNLEPYFQRGRSGSIWGGILAVFVTTPVWYGGFNVIPQVMEERSPGTALRSVGRVILFSIAAAGFFYCLIILASTLVRPWPALVKLELPAAGAFRAAFRSPWAANLVLVAALLGLVTTWNAVLVAASRVLFALGRARIISPVFGDIHPRFHTPHRALLFVFVVASGGVFLGRSVILPIVNMGATCFAFAYLLTALGVIRLRETRPGQERPCRVPGGKATAAVTVLVCLFMFLLSLYQPYESTQGVLPLEWILLLGWIVLGTLFWVLADGVRKQVGEAARRKLILGNAAPEI